LREIISKVENLKNNRNYEIAIEAGRYKSEAYKANIKRRIRRLIYYRKYKSNKSRFDGVDNKSNIRNKSKAAARL
jgi:hypothetical protein